MTGNGDRPGLSGIDPVRLRRPGAPETYHSAYRGLCPACRRLVDGVRVLRGGGVWGRRHCPDHGASEALLSSDEAWFLRSLAYVKPASLPLAHSARVARGCPDDCGLCPEHGQHTCLPILEIVGSCNLRCPVCLVEAGAGHTMSRQEVASVLDGLLVCEGAIDTVNLSGGEPTLHPDLLGVVDAARRPGVGRVSLTTNGTVLADNPELCRALAARGVYVNVQFDGSDGRARHLLRGQADGDGVSHRALANLLGVGARTTLVTTVARGVNEGAVGEALKLLLQTPGILSLMVQPVAYVGRAEQLRGSHEEPPLTIPDVIDLLVGSSDGLLRPDDFVPLPCSHPSCFALTYLLLTDDGPPVPFPRFVSPGVYLGLLANRGMMWPDGRMEEALHGTIDELWTGIDQNPESRRILEALRAILKALYNTGRAVEFEERLRLGEASVKTIFIHAFMDAHSFDLERVRRCCTHYALPDGRLMPACAFNVLHRPRSRAAPSGGGR